MTSMEPSKTPAAGGSSQVRGPLKASQISDLDQHKWCIYVSGSTAVVSHPTQHRFSSYVL